MTALLIIALAGDAAFFILFCMLKRVTDRNSAQHRHRQQSLADSIGNWQRHAAALEQELQRNSGTRWN